MRYKLFFVLILLCVQQVGFSQTDSTNIQRPKIGLVLSGGGAKGLAHIGVLKVLEKAGIVPDYITGTSMGSIIGGLYAIGYSPDELEKIVNEINWDAILSNTIPLNQITYEEKEYYARYIAELPVEGVKVKLPRGLIEGQKLSELLIRLTRPVHEIHNFHDLPVPFACVATDLETGDPEMLDHGSLPNAIRASMAIPSIFTPVELDGKLLVDGGMVRNFPVEEVINMGADIVIGVFVSNDALPKEELNSIVSVMTQSAFLIGIADSRKQIDSVDIYIEPSLKDYNAGSFKQGAAIIKIGEETAEPFYEKLKNLADSLKAIAPLHKIEKLPAKDNYHISRIQVNGNNKISSRLIRGKLRITEGSDLSIHDIEKRISILYGTRYFDRVTYEIRQIESGNELVINVVESPDGVLKLMASYDTENDLCINGNITYRNFLMPNSRAITDVILSKFPGLNASYLKYIGERQDAGIIFGGGYHTNNLPYFENNRRVTDFNVDQINLYCQVQSTSFLNFTFGVRSDVDLVYQKAINQDTSFTNIKRVQNRQLRLSIFTEYNSYNRQYFPSSGTAFDISYSQSLKVWSRQEFLEGDPVTGNNDPFESFLKEFGTFKSEVTYIHPFSKKVSLVLNNKMILSGMEDFDYNLLNYQYVGGFNPVFDNGHDFMGSEQKLYMLSQFFMMRAKLQIELDDNLFISGTIDYIDAEYPMKWIIPASDENTLNGKKRRAGYGLSLGYNSIFGPLSFSVSKDHIRDKVLTHINVGFWLK